MSHATRGREGLRLRMACDFDCDSDCDCDASCCIADFDVGDGIGIGIASWPCGLQMVMVLIGKREVRYKNEKDMELSAARERNEHK